VEVLLGVCDVVDVDVVEEEEMGTDDCDIVIEDVVVVIDVEESVVDVVVIVGGSSVGRV
jgi:hypothetical protein